MSNLKKELIRLGAKEPDLRKHLKPVLDEVTKIAGGGFAKVIHKWLGFYERSRDARLEVVEYVRSRADEIEKAVDTEFSDPDEIRIETVGGVEDLVVSVTVRPVGKYSEENTKEAIDAAIGELMDRFRNIAFKGASYGSVRASKKRIQKNVYQVGLTIPLPSLPVYH